MSLTRILIEESNSINKNEILDKSRKEDNYKDVARNEVEKQASHTALSVGTAICLIISAIEWIGRGTRNDACWTLLFGMMSAMKIIKYIKLKRRSNLVIAILSVVLFLFFGHCYLAALFGEAS